MEEESNIQPEPPIEYPSDLPAFQDAEVDTEEEKEEIYPDDAAQPDEALIRELAIHGSADVW